MADKRLFEQPLSIPENQDLESRLAYGRAGVATKNLTFNNLISWLNNKLSFLKPSQNLNDVANKATARNNLEVYAKAETYNKSEIDYLYNTLNNKFGGMYVIGGVYCGIDGDGNKVVNVLFGTLNMNINNFNKISTGRYEIVHNIGHYGYMPLANIVGGWGTPNNNKVAQIDRDVNHIHITFGDDDSNNDLVRNSGVFVLFIGF